MSSPATTHSQLNTMNTTSLKSPDIIPKDVRRSRTKLNSEAKEFLLKIYANDKFPNLEKRISIALLLKSTPRKVQVWFQNRRSAEKTYKQQRRSL